MNPYQYKLFIEQSPSAIAMLDTEMRYVACSTRWIQDLVFGDTDIIGKCHYEIFPEIDVSWRAIHQRCLAGATEKCDEDSFLRSDGSTDYLRWEVKPWRDSEKKIGGIIIFSEVITRRVLAEKLLRSSVKETIELKGAIDKHSILATTDLQGRILSVNDNFLRISKYSREELIGQNHRIISSGYHPSSFWEIFWNTISAGKVWQGDVKNQAKDGSTYWVATTVMPILDEGGKVHQYMAIRTDITDKKHKEMDHSFILTSLGIGSWTVDLQTEEYLWDANMQRLYGTSPEKGISAHEAWSRSLSPESKDLALKERDAAIRGEHSFDCCFQITLPSGEKRDLRSVAFVVRDKNGKAIQMHGINVDRSKEVALEKEMLYERAKAIQSAKLASLGELAAGIGHEINNPLAVISGTLDILPKLAQNPYKLGEKIRSLQKSCIRISSIVNGLRKFSRSSTGVPHSAVPLGEIIREVLDLTQVKSRQFDTTVSFDIRSEGSILCDQVAIGQVLINLVNNAVDAVKDKSERWVRVELTESQDLLILRVIDSGNGIPENIRAKLFDPFFTTKKVGEGTGLGLSITKGILDEHHAKISVIAEYPNTCFELCFLKAT